MDRSRSYDSQVIGPNLGVGLVVLSTFTIACIVYGPQLAELPSASPSESSSWLIEEREFIAASVSTKCVCTVKCTCASNYCCKEAKAAQAREAGIVTGEDATGLAHALEEKANLKAQLDKQQKDDNAAQKAAADAATQVQQDLAAKLKQATAELKDREETLSKPGLSKQTAVGEAKSEHQELDKQKKETEELKKQLANVHAQAQAQGPKASMEEKQIKDLKKQLDQAQKSKADQSKDTELEKENKQIEDLKKQLDETQVTNRATPPKDELDKEKAQVEDLKKHLETEATKPPVQSAEAKHVVQSLTKQTQEADHGALDAIKAAEQVAAAVAANSSATYADIQTADKDIAIARGAFAEAKIVEAKANGAASMQRALGGQ